MAGLRAATVVYRRVQDFCRIKVVNMVVRCGTEIVGGTVASELF